jgi:peptidoglycan DL-endopeptidase CwlO
VKKAAVLGVAALALYAGGHQAAARASGPAAVKAVAYARAQLGKPYQWGGAGPGAYDCSGLTWAAWTSAGAAMGQRSTAAGQYATERHVAIPAAGDLVFFAGADGTTASPGHVGIVTDPGRRVMIDAYATGYPVGYDTYGPGATRPGLSNPVGFTDPTA